MLRLCKNAVDRENLHQRASQVPGPKGRKNQSPAA